MPHTSENQVIALAVEEGFGVDLNLGTAGGRTLERLCVLWWLGYAQGRGVKVTVPFGSSLLDHPLRYGYDYRGEVEWCNTYLEQVAIEVEPWKEKIS